VKVQMPKKKLEEKKLIDPETAYYLEKFLGQTGQVFDITMTKSGFTTYHVNFGNEIGIFYADEVTHAE
jgi:hypothetical protein